MSVTEKIEQAQSRGHHKYSISKLNYYKACPGFENRQWAASEAAEEGTMLHGIMETALDLGLNGEDVDVIQAIPYAVDRLPISDDQKLLLEWCAQHVDFWLRRAGLRSVTNEGRVEIPDVTAGSYDVLLTYENGGAVIIDYKFGRIAVPPAEENLQGMGYAVGAMLADEKITAVGVVFLQPRLDLKTECVFRRKDLAKLLAEIKSVVRAAQAPRKTLKVCEYCNYCAKHATCPAVLAHIQSAALATRDADHTPLPVPSSFNVSDLSLPEQAAMARYWVTLLEPAFEEIKRHAKELAVQNGGTLRCSLPDGTDVVYDVVTRKAARAIRSPNLVAEALSDTLTPDQVLGAAKRLQISTLEQIFADAAVQKAAEAGEELTRRDAVDQLHERLESNGLISRPDSTTEFLRERKEKRVLSVSENASN